jgi:hypothetical protein
MSVPLCYYGSPDALPAVRPLRAGPLSLIYEAGDLRYVRLGEKEIIRRIYVAVRDRNWGTVPARLMDEEIDAQSDRFCITYDAEHRQGEIHFRWRAQITGASDGAIAFTMSGEALSTFERNRIGFCVLHPIQECAGARCRLEHGNGAAEESKLPQFIAPRNPFADLRALSHEIDSGLWAELCFEGDLFEMEDQRNWIDASFKTFCTPLRLPFPVTVEAGSRICQAVSLRLNGRVAVVPAAPSEPTFTITTQPVGTLPQVGLCTAGHGSPFMPREVERLRLLRPAHLRVELDLTGANIEDRLRRAATEAELLGTGLEAAITVSDEAWSETRHLIRLLHAVNPPLRRVLLFHNRDWATPARIVQPGVEAIARYNPSIPVYAGTTANFAELNRGRPQSKGIGGTCYSIKPQEHVFDNASLIECCAAIRDTVRSAQQFCGGLPIAVTPITFRKRVNPYATGPAAPTAAGELPPTADPRQMSLFGAGWTLAALKYLAESGVASATFFETVGWRGVMECAQGCPLPGKFPSRPGMVFPLYHVLADVGEFATAEVLPSLSSHPLHVDGLALRRGRTVRVMLANLMKQPQNIVVRGLPAEVLIRTLDEGSYEGATSDDVAGFRAEPEASRRGIGPEVSPRPLYSGGEGSGVRGALSRADSPLTPTPRPPFGGEGLAGSLQIHLRPYSYARIDCN